MQLWQTGYNTEIQRVARLTKMEVRTTETYSPWQNKAGIYIKIIKGKAKRRRVQRNTPKRVWDFGMVWEADIYSRTEQDVDSKPIQISNTMG